MAVNIIKRTWHQNQMVKIEPLNGFAFQAESGGHTFQISGVDDSGNAVPISGTIAGVFLRPDNTDVALNGSASGGVASVTLTAECYAVPGRFLLTVYATSGSNKGTIYAAMGTVSRTSSGAVSPAAASDVVDLVNRIDSATATIPASYTTLLNAVAGDYSDTKTYAVKDFVWYNGHLYRCTTAITTAETWTAGHWKQVVLADALNQDITDLKSAISNVNKFIDDSVVIDSGVWVRKGIKSSTGAYQDNDTRLATPDSFSFDKSLQSIQTTDNGYDIALFGYESSYLGCWNGTSFVKGTITWFKSIDVYNFSRSNTYRIVVKSASGDNVDILPAEGEKITMTFRKTDNAMFNEFEAACNISGINSSDGGNVTVTPGSALTRLRTGYIDERINYISTTGMYYCSLYAYTGAGTFIGVWNGTTFVTGTITWMREIDIASIKNNLGGCKYRIVTRKLCDAVFPNVDEALKNTHMYGEISCKTHSENFCNYYVYSTELDAYGVLQKNTSFETTNFIKIPKRIPLANYLYDPFRYLVIFAQLNGTYSTDNFESVCFYDKNKTFLTTVTTTPIETNENAEFVRITFSKNASYRYIGFKNSPNIAKYVPYNPVVPGEELPYIRQTNSDGAITNLLRTVSEYVNNDEFGYGNNYTAFNETCAKVESDGRRLTDGTMDSDPLYTGERYQLDCSSFTKLSVSCITPKNSRYMNAQNRIPLYGFVFSDDCQYDTEYGRLTANKQAKYAKQHQWLYEINSDFSNVMVGDILFVSDNADDTEAFFDGISHSMIVVKIVENISGSRTIYIAEARYTTSSVVTIGSFSSRYSSKEIKIHYGARFPIPYATNATIIGEAHESDVAISSGGGTLAEITLNEAIRAKEVYTIKWKTDASSTANILVYAENSSLNSDGYSIDADGNGTLHFMTIDSDYSSAVSKTGITVSVSGNSTNSVHVDYVKMYKGFVS